MNKSKLKIVEWFLRLTLSAGFLSAVADRFGLWPKEISVWGNWANFVDYTQTLNPCIPAPAIPLLAITATILEIILAIGLVLKFKTSLVAICSGILLLLFATAMVFSVNIKAPFDYSVFAGSAAAFALSAIVNLKSPSNKVKK